MLRINTLLLLTLVATGTVSAQETTSEVPVVSEKSGAAQEELEAPIKIEPPKRTKIEKIRVGERVVIKITPSKGVPYYLLDADGDGDPETKVNDIGPSVAVPMWEIFNW